MNEDEDFSAAVAATLFILVGVIAVSVATCFVMVVG